VARVEGVDRKSFLAVAESRTGIDRFRFCDYPVEMPQADAEETNIYGIRLTKHEDGCIYGAFCVELHDPAHLEDPSAAIARCGIARTRSWNKRKCLDAKEGRQHLVAGRR
jgi:4-O-beta-D-mannosyl-D-glucose phosphorylase